MRLITFLLIKNIILTLFIMGSITICGQEVKQKKELQISNFENFEMSAFNFNISNENKIKRTVILDVLRIGQAKYTGFKESKITGIAENDLSTGSKFRST